MITLCRTLFFVSLFVAIGSLILPANRGVPIGKRLSGEPEYWSFTFSTPDHRLMGATEETSKQMLLSYLQGHRLSDGPPLSWLTAPAIVAAIFSLLAWRRERDFQRRTSGCTQPGDGAAVDNRKPAAPGR
jgi:hypothetical protein